MPLLLLHGTEILGLLAGTLVGLIVFPAVILWLWSHPPRMPLVPTIFYLLLASIAFIAFQIDDNGYFLLLAYIVSLPWSIILVLVTAFFEIDIATMGFLIASAINALLIYGTGTLAKRRDSM